MAVSRKLCGAVIGQKGQTIRDFMADSGATIRVQPLSELTPSDSERLITVSGGRDKVLRAVALVLNTVRAAQLQDLSCLLHIAMGGVG
jgi:RNA-binding protein Nova